MGYALAAAARDAGAAVTLISGPTGLTAPVDVSLVPVETTLQMRDAVQAACVQADVLIMNAAVADFRPDTVAEQKIKKQGRTDGLVIELVPNPDILGELVGSRLFKVGFAAETQNLLENAREKLARKKLDMIIGNEAVVSMSQAEIEVTLIDSAGEVVPLSRQTKEQTATAIIDVIVERLEAVVSYSQSE
jgi:phosphopantothenoylcysteine decarboxylase/phosphopantothenate--cysteine ligase